MQGWDWGWRHRCHRPFMHCGPSASDTGNERGMMQFEKIEQYSSIFAKLGGLSVLVETSWG